MISGFRSEWSRLRSDPHLGAFQSHGGTPIAAIAGWFGKSENRWRMTVASGRQDDARGPGSGSVIIYTWNGSAWQGGTAGPWISLDGEVTVAMAGLTGVHHI